MGKNPGIFIRSKFTTSTTLVPEIRHLGDKEITDAVHMARHVNNSQYCSYHAEVKHVPYWTVSSEIVYTCMCDH